MGSDPSQEGALPPRVLGPPWLSSELHALIPPLKLAVWV